MRRNKMKNEGLSGGPRNAILMYKRVRIRRHFVPTRLPARDRDP